MRKKILDLRKKKFLRKEIERRVNALAIRLVSELKKRKLKITTMESCLGGALINEITNVPGASQITDGALIVYSKKEKIKRGVSKKIIENFGLYSFETALEMAQAAKKEIPAQISIGATGVLTRKDPQEGKIKVGEVYFGLEIGTQKLGFKILLPASIQKEGRALEKKLVVLKILETLIEKLKFS